MKHIYQTNHNYENKKYCRAAGAGGEQPAGTVPVEKPAAEQYGADIVPGWVRIRLKEEAGALRTGRFTRGAVATGHARIDRLADELGATEVRCVFPNDSRFENRHRRYGLHLWYDVKIDESVAVTRAAERFAAEDEVAYVGPIYRMRPSDAAVYGATIRSGALPAAEDGWQGSRGEGEHAAPFDDPMLKWQWHYDNDGSMPGSVEGADIGVYDVWKDPARRAGDPSVIVAIMDVAIDYEHEDLASSMWINAGEIPGNGLDDDGNGYVDDVYGYDFYENTGNLTPGAHGTHVAGTVAAVNNNGVGVCGVAGGSGQGDGVRLMSCPLYPPTGDDTTTGVAAYVYAADNGAVISQNSWNFSNMDQTPEDLRVALEYFVNEGGKDDLGNQTGPMAGGVIFFSASNNYNPVEVTPPAQEECVISVAAMCPDYARAGYSNISADVDILAPGGAGVSDTKFGSEGKVLSTGWNQEEGYSPNSYVYMSGTSMACPHVSGVAALIVANYGGAGFTADRLKEILLRSYRPVDAWQVDPSIAERLGVGLVDAGLIGLQETTVAPEGPARVTAAPYDKVEGALRLAIEGIPADGNGMPVAAFRVTYRAAEGAEQQLLIPNRLSVGQTLETEVTGLADATTYTFSVWAQDRFGRESLQAVTCEGTTLAHANRDPELVQSLSPVSLPQGDGEEGFRTTLDLTAYFTDPDLPDDELTFTASSRDEQVATAAVQGAQLVIEARHQGSTIVEVTVTDRAGASITRNMSVTVTCDNPYGGGEPDPDPDPDPDPQQPTLAAGLTLYPNPVETTATIGVAGAGSTMVRLRIYDSAAGLVMEQAALALGVDGTDSAVCDLSALAPGAYTMTVRLENGREYHRAFLKK